MKKWQAIRILVEQVKIEARKNGQIPTRAKVLNLAARREKMEKEKKEEDTKGAFGMLNPVSFTHLFWSHVKILLKFLSEI